MKNKKLIIYVLVFVLLIGGAYLLYSNLSQNAAPGQLATAPNAPTEESNESTQSTAPAADLEATQETEPPKVAAPDFQVYDADGKAVKLSDFRGKPVILNFWSSNCGPCRMEMPHFESAFQEYGDRIHFMMLNVTDGSWDTVDSASKFIAENQYTFPVFFDKDVNASNTYGIRSLPTTYFIDADGNFVAYSRGAIQAQVLQQGIDMLLPS